MSERDVDPAGVHRRAWDAIPWIVNGRASAEQRRLVQDHVNACADCRSELARQRDLHAAMAADEHGTDEGRVEAGLQDLMVRIDRAQAEGNGGEPRPRDAPHALTRWLTAAVVVEALALAALAVGVTLRQDPLPSYVTLGEHSPDPVSATIRIVPSPSLRVDDLQRMLQPLDLQIVSGPNSVGAYDLAPRSGRPARERQLAALRAQAGLKLVEPIDAREPSR